MTPLLRIQLAGVHPKDVEQQFGKQSSFSNLLRLESIHVLNHFDGLQLYAKIRL